MTTPTISKDQEDRLNQAAENFEEMQKRIAPFIKPRVIINKTTQGKWKRASNEDMALTHQGFLDDLKKVAYPCQAQPREGKFRT